MSSLAMAAHHHKHHHGTKPSHWKLPSLLHHLEAKFSSLMAIAHGAQGPGPQRMFFIGLALTLVLLVVAVRKVRRS